MKKDLDWIRHKIEAFQTGDNMFTAEFNAGVQDALEYVQELINQLDEPETLSLDWIDDNKKDSGVHSIGYYVPIGRLHDLLVPKQEEVNQAYKDGYEKGKQHTFYKGYLEGLADKEKEPETVADVVSTFWKSFERLKEVMSMEVEELEE